MLRTVKHETPKNTLDLADSAILQHGPKAAAVHFSWQRLGSVRQVANLLMIYLESSMTQTVLSTWCELLNAIRFVIQGSIGREPDYWFPRLALLN